MHARQPADLTFRRADAVLAAAAKPLGYKEDASILMRTVMKGPHSIRGYVATWNSKDN